ncbi:MAG: InlB B-repeat-containing protein, partial [Lachnospiraceae bacterium]|nr:InlB B-repeat-containing protein [Lachnospiraceae bacterium]
DRVEFSIEYPTGASVGDYGFNTSYAKTDGTRGTIEPLGEPSVNGNVTTQNYVINDGVMLKNATPYIYYYLNFPKGNFADGDKVTTSLTNMVFYASNGATLTVADPITSVTYTLVDPDNDMTKLAAVNRTTGDGVYNYTGLSDDPTKTIVSFGGCRITNTATVSTPFDKTYEASFNTTNTAAAITYVTVPLGDSSSPVVKLTGKKKDGTIKTITVTEPLDKRMATRYAMEFYADDYEFTTFTGVYAEIGKLITNYDSCSWTSNFDPSANYSSVYGYFTTDEPGIVVQNSFRLYNTDPEYRQNSSGDLSISSSAVSSTEARVGYQGTNPGIYNEKNSSVTAVDAEEIVRAQGTVYPYSAPYACGYRKSNGAAANIYGNASAVEDPILYVTLPAGMTLNKTAFRLDSYSYYNNRTSNKTLTEGKDYTVENISYMNTSNEDMNLYRITFSGITLGYVEDGTDANKNNEHSMMRNQLYYQTWFQTSKILETKIYYIKDLLGISSKNQETALPYSSGASLCVVMKDKYGINGGIDYASVVPGTYETKGFGVQQQAEVSINNAVTVENIDGGEASSKWLSYDESDPNSILMLGRKTTGQYRLRIANTSSLSSSNIEVLVPIPQKKKTLGKAFMYNAEDTSFDFNMDVTWEDGNLSGFTANYVIFDPIDVWNSETDLTYTICETEDQKESANAILLTKDTADPNTTYEIALNYSVDESENDPNLQNIFRNVFKYKIGDVSYTGLGSYVACEIAQGKLSGTAFYDQNRNGILDEEETPLSGVSVVAKDGKGKIQSVTTDVNGKYEFKAIREEDITVSYSLGTGNENYRFNVSSDGLKITADKQSATADYESLPKDAIRDIPLATFWTLTYNGNGSAVTGLVPNAGEYDSDNAVATVRVKPDNLVNPGYAFVCWNTQADGEGTDYLPNATLTMTGDMTLYAKWTEATYNVYLDYRGAETGNELTQFTVVYKEKFYEKLPTSATREGYTLKGWRSDNSTSTSVFKNTDTYTYTTDKTFYAVWTAKSGFNITYETGDGTTVSPRTVAWTDSALPKSDTPLSTRVGYEIAGWKMTSYTDEHGEKVELENAELIAENASYGELAKKDEYTGITLSAVWTPKSGYKVNYALNQPENLAEGTAVIPDHYDALSVSWTQTNLLPTQAPSCDGYAFEGWYYRNPDNDNESAVTPDLAYYMLVGNSIQQDGSELSEITLSAKWEKVEGPIVHYNTDGGTTVNDKVLESYSSTGLIPEAGATTKAGYTLSGWRYYEDDSKYKEVNKDTSYSSLAGNSKTSITLTAVWSEKEYIIQYNYDGLAELPEKKWSDAGLISDEAKDIARTGYTFSHWSYDGNVVKDDTKVSQLIPDDDVKNNTIILTPNWTEKTYNVVYDSDGGSAVSSQSGIRYTASGFLTSSTPNKTGYTFEGWYYEETKVSATSSIESLIAKAENADKIVNLTLTANYTPKSGYVVRYDTAGGSEIDSKTDVSWNSDNLLPEKNPVKTGYSFQGWSGGRVTNVTKSTTYSDVAESNDTQGYITLVASWKVQSYAITYRNANGTIEGGEFSGYDDDVTAPTSHTYGTVTNLIAPKRSGYDFGGWYIQYD